MRFTRTRAREKTRLLSVIILSSAVTGASAIPALASGCTSIRDIAASRARWSTVRSQPTKATDNDANCRSYASSFYESVTLRQTTATCVRDTDDKRNLAVLDSEVDALNNLLATKCGGSPSVGVRPEYDLGCDEERSLDGSQSYREDKGG